MELADLAELSPKAQLAVLLGEKARRRSENKLLEYVPYPKQLAFHLAGADPAVRERLLIAGNQLGKALHDDTPVLTPAGWVRIADLKVGDKVIAGDGAPTTVLGVYPQGEVDLLRLTFDQGESVLCCKDHLWKVLHPAARFPTRHSHGKVEANPRYGRWDVVSTSDMLEASGSDPAPRRRFLTPYSGEWQFEGRDVPVDPYVLGLLLGDGCLRNGVSLCSADQEIVDAFRTEAAKFGLVVNKRGSYDWNAVMPGGKAARGNAGNAGNALIDALRGLGAFGKMAHEKSVPDLYLLNDRSVRLALLQGLMDTDGSAATGGAVEFCSTSEELARAVEFLVHSFGGKCKTTWRVTSYTHKEEKRQGRPSARMRIRLPHVPLFRLARKMARVVRPVSTTDHRVLWSIHVGGKGAATCIKVEHPDATFVIQHGLVTHNTWSAGYETAMHLTGRYPDWWRGAVFDSKVAAWACGVTGEVTRDSVQRVLCGRINALGTGAIPGDAIKDKSLKRGVADAIDTLAIRWGGGGDLQAQESLLGFKSYDQGREKFQSESLDLVWLDEEPPEDIYTEALTRTNATNGIVYMTFTPLLGMSGVVRRFLIDKPKGTHVTTMTIDDALHYTPEQRAQIIQSYPAHEREARAKGIPTLGSGRIFPVSEEVIREMPVSLPAHWPRIVGIDFGWDHPTAAVWLAWDRDTDTVHVYDAYRVREATPLIHAAAIKAKGPWIPVAWPHDGLQHDKGSGEQLAAQYRAHGLAMLKDRATFADGSNGVEAGLMDMLDRMQTGRLKVAKHLHDWWEEFRLYHREDGKVVKQGDDLMSATRYALMSLRYAKVQALPQRVRTPQYRTSVPGMGVLG